MIDQHGNVLIFIYVVRRFAVLFFYCAVCRVNVARGDDGNFVLYFRAVVLIVFIRKIAEQPADHRARQQHGNKKFDSFQQNTEDVGDADFVLPLFLIFVHCSSETA